MQSTMGHELSLDVHVRLPCTHVHVHAMISSVYECIPRSLARNRRFVNIVIDVGGPGGGSPGWFGVVRQYR